MFFQKKNGLYFLSVIILIVLFGLFKGWGYTISYVSILCGLFVPLFIAIETNKIGFHLYKKEKVPISRILIYLLYIIVAITVYFFLLDESQAKMLFTISGILSVLLLLILVIVTYRK